MNTIQRLAQLGQSIWLDHIERRLMSSGRLREMIAEGLRGMTSNPTIFEKAFANTADYDRPMKRLLDAGATPAEIYFALTVEDVSMAADAFRPVFEDTRGADGFVSIEVSPQVAYDTEETLAEARRLWRTLHRPNVMIKIPATPAGLPAIETALTEGINVNITLMFSMAHYEAVAEAYLRALEARNRMGLPNRDIASVASFFVSRVDTLIDQKLEALAASGGEPGKLAASLLGKAGIANSRCVYQRFQEILSSDRFKRLTAAGARPQRLLWASTSTKNPKYPDTLYVDNLVGADTINTLPLETYEAVLDHGRAERTVDADPAESARVLAQLRSLGLELQAIGERLSAEGVRKFADSFEAAHRAIEQKLPALQE